MNVKYKNFEEQLEYLKLCYIRENYKELIAASEKKQMSNIDFLCGIIDAETVCKQEKALQRRLRNAKLPYIKTMDQYNWNHPQKINRMQIEGLFRLDFIERHENIIFIGSCGTGKTHASLALAKAACEKGYSTLFTSAVDIINHLSAAVAVNNLERAIKKYLTPQLIVIDEVGFLTIDKQGANLLFQVISKRYETGSIIVTSNRPFKEWPKIFNNDSTITSAVLDRLLHHSHVVVIEGKSYRMKDKV
ncbi:MAG: IS21-like element helper ATPase IstB [Candidatus Auribacterota bacterium]|nr:IS21-like element helper ATPase IstB [Candidatus Auribacterota bacterium]